MNIQIADIEEDLVGLDGFVEEEKITILIDYPLSVDAKFTYRSKNGFSKVRLAQLIGKSYKKVYANESKYGIWGHSILDLVLEGIEVRRKSGDVVIYPIVGS